MRINDGCAGVVGIKVRQDTSPPCVALCDWWGIGSHLYMQHWASRLLRVSQWKVDLYFRGTCNPPLKILDAQLPIHFDPIEDGQYKTSHHLFSKSMVRFKNPNTYVNRSIRHPDTLMHRSHILVWVNYAINLMIKDGIHSRM